MMKLEEIRELLAIGILILTILALGALLLRSLIGNDAGAAEVKKTPEKVYVTKWCGERHGETRYTFEDGTKPDCLTKDFVVEFDFGPKWYECLEQARHYAFESGQSPVCVLILRKDETRYLKRARRNAALTTSFIDGRMQSVEVLTIDAID